MSLPNPRTRALCRRKNSTPASLTGRRMPPRTTQQSHRPHIAATQLAGAPPRHEERSNLWTGIRRNATLYNRAAHGGWMSDNYLLHAEGEKCFFLVKLA